MTEKEGGTIAEEVVWRDKLLLKAKKIEEERKDQETASGKGITKFQNPEMSEPTQCCS